jgi:hypothetical protein
MATGFVSDIKPYFTACFRAHMIRFFDLWVREDVESNFQGIFDKVFSESMPAKGCGEGVWDPQTRAQFLEDFQSWNDGGFQP